ncbi:MAG: PQQ-binding-like beta-propeller repeat protein [Pirellulales bacterium]
MRRVNWVMAMMAWGVAAVLGGTAAVADSGDWPQFRGGAALGKAAATVPLDWAADRNLAWRTPIPGSGWSQPVVAGGRIYVTTAVADNAKRPSGMGGVMSLSTWGWGSAPSDPLEFRVLCLDPADGRIVWSKTVADVKPTFGKHASNTFATETPCAAADGVYAFFGAIGTLVALDRDGTERWRRDLGPQPIQNQFGTGSSPLLHGGRLFIQRYNEEQGQLLCLDAATGRDLWTAAGPKGTSWSTPFVWTNAGVEEVVSAGQGMIVAHAVADGQERWRFGGIDTSFACSPVADAEYVYFGTSSPGSKAPAAAIKGGGSGDLTLRKGEKASDRVPWSRTKSGAGMPSPVVVGEHLYFFDKIAVCLDKRTGAELYRKRLPSGTSAIGSPLVIGDRIYLVNEKGKTVVVKAGPAFELLAESSLGDTDEIFWATPAVAGNSLYIRSSDALYCIREPQP